MYSCPGCGSQMTFDIAGQQLKCGRCERTMSIIVPDLRGGDPVGERCRGVLLQLLRVVRDAGADAEGGD